MDAETARWVAGVAIGIVLALIGLVWGLIKTRQDKAEERQERADGRLASHVVDDTAIHERVVRLETDMFTLKDEVKSLREMRHEIMTHTTQSLASWYASVVETISKRFAELVAMIERLK